MKDSGKKKKSNDKDKKILKKPAPEKKVKRAKPVEHDEDEPIEIELEEPEELEGVDEEPPGKVAGPRRKGRPPKVAPDLDTEDEFDPDALPDNDEVGDQDLSIPRKPKKLNGSADQDGARNGDDPAKATRLGLIRTRHEAMRREIDQIREDLESDEEE